MDYSEAWVNFSYEFPRLNRVKDGTTETKSALETSTDPEPHNCIWNNFASTNIYVNSSIITQKNVKFDTEHHMT